MTKEELELQDELEAEQFKTDFEDFRLHQILNEAEDEIEIPVREKRRLS